MPSPRAAIIAVVRFFMIQSFVVATPMWQAHSVCRNPRTAHESVPATLSSLLLPDEGVYGRDSHRAAAAGLMLVM